MGVETLSYAIDDQDRLIRLDEGFHRFARENGWEEAGASLGRSLWHFVHGHDVVRLQKILVRRIREGNGPVTLPFRCDSPSSRRELDMRIAADRSGRVVLFTARLQAEVERAEPQPLLSARARRGGDFLPMCAWCDRFLVGGEWVEVEVASERLQLFRRRDLPALDHTVCPRCSGTLLAA